MNTRLSFYSARSLLALLLLLPGLALANAGIDAGHHHAAWSAFASGLSHPFTGLDHLAAMVALGCWSALSAKRIWAAPLAFATALLLGACLGFWGVSTPAIEPMIAVSVLVLGLMLATKVQWPTYVGSALAAAFALFHGMAHGAELAGAHVAPVLAGLAVGTALLHSAGIGLGFQLRKHSLWWRRATGASVALLGWLLVTPLN